jgi:hypothetical protein
MSIVNELSSDVAAAVLINAENKVQTDPKALMEIVRDFYSALRPLTKAARRRRTKVLPSIEPPAPSPKPNSRAASGNS